MLALLPCDMRPPLVSLDGMADAVDCDCEFFRNNFEFVAEVGEWDCCIHTRMKNVPAVILLKR